ncbi:MAG: mannose-1-phosphate guanylyltransferase [Bacteroidota bacterium]
MTYAVIMAGGIGSRFWPASRKGFPKQFLQVFGEATLIQNTVARLQGLIPPERCLIVTHERYIELTRQQLPAVPPENILAEPISRNTAPCIAFAAMRLMQEDPDATMVVLPADHVISNVRAFHKVLGAAIQQAQTPGTLVTIGINPTHPATGYGYIQFEGTIVPGAEPQAFPVRTFAEKPGLETAERFVDSGDFLWNSGMFIWRVDTILGQIQEHLPEAYTAFQPLADALGTEHEAEAVLHAFQQSPKISIDYGVMEQATSVYVVPGSFGWNDVGDWKAVYDLSEKDEHGNALRGLAVVHDASRSLVHAQPDRLVALIGVHDLVVVDTGDAVLICNRENAQQVKNVVNHLHATNSDTFI